MSRPLLLRILPDRLKVGISARFYRAGPRRSDLYLHAPLAYARGVSMAQLVPGDVISDSIAYTGIYDLDKTRRICDLARIGGTLVDVGANLGYFSLLWASAGRANKVFSFEASPRNVGILRANVARNQLEDQIAVFGMAVGEARGQLAFDVGPGDQTGWGGIASVGSMHSIPVDVVRVDESILADEPIDLLKIDIEGFDTRALRGCEGLLRRKRIREVWFEANKPRMKKLGIADGEAQKFLRELGYRCEPLSDPKDAVVEWRAAPDRAQWKSEVANTR